MRRWLLSKKDRKRLQRRLSEQYPRLDVSGVERIEVVVEGPVRLYVFDSISAFIEDEQVFGERLVPHLLYLLRRGYSWLPAIVVDEGAVRPISRGADLMRPGVLDLRGSFAAGDVVVVVEPSRGLPLAVHEALLGSEELLAAQRGRVAKCLHHVGDRYWKLGEAL
jgi:predicted RNA-binding protein (TIGR00451 family)